MAQMKNEDQKPIVAFWPGDPSSQKELLEIQAHLSAKLLDADRFHLVDLRGDPGGWNELTTPPGYDAKERAWQSAGAWLNWSREVAKRCSVIFIHVEAESGFLDPDFVRLLADAESRKIPVVGVYRSDRRTQLHTHALSFCRVLLAIDQGDSDEILRFLLSTYTGEEDAE